MGLTTSHLLVLGTSLSISTIITNNPPPIDTALPLVILENCSVPTYEGEHVYLLQPGCAIKEILIQSPKTAVLPFGQDEIEHLRYSQLTSKTIVGITENDYISLYDLVHKAEVKIMVQFSRSHWHLSNNLKIFSAMTDLALCIVLYIWFVMLNTRPPLAGEVEYELMEAIEDDQVVKREIVEAIPAKVDR